MDVALIPDDELIKDYNIIDSWNEDITDEKHDEMYDKYKSKAYNNTLSEIIQIELGRRTISKARLETSGVEK